MGHLNNSLYSSVTSGLASRSTLAEHPPTLVSSMSVRYQRQDNEQSDQQWNRTFSLVVLLHHHSGSSTALMVTA